ncbi:MAG: putative phosphoglycerate mutase [Microgenomates group bacterium Gr01-1014_16]|nr:MAG: putative phosphoglycerate mutase [Microgenomates group bacterium Gr01-1014_16]
MKIYLLRHGKSEEHEKQIRQHPGSDLGPEGKKQAKKVAKRLKAEPIEVIISSPWPRALTTAKIVARAMKLPVIIDERAHEIIQNPVLNGLPYDHQLAREFLETVKKQGKDVDWKFRVGKIPGQKCVVRVPRIFSVGSGFIVPGG